MNTESLKRYREVLKRPLFTEKSHFDQGKRNAYHFEVLANANKIEIRRAIEAIFNVKVLSVNTVRRMGKELRRGYLKGHFPDTKRAIVSLQAGQAIEYV
ncbi:MAG: 50S ribosomal protein L23 [Planctomycetota bacterium]